MSIFNVFSLFGGLALFLYGMDAMGKALEKQAGGKLQNILAKLTNNRFKGFLLGLLVTAVIQSSSATTVMVVGFVNSGIMALSQAIGIIMGANVGTTVTAWILSLAGVEGDSFWIQLLKPTSFSPVLAVIGILLYMGAKSDKKKNIGVILLGFAILMTGMTAMSSAVEPLSDVPQFTNLFIMFQNPILGLLVGAVLTGIIQSSSASVGILQALALSTGAVTYGSAIPIIMGQNIGTTVTAMLSSVGANKNARRTALVHLYFNVIGSAAFLILFYALNAVIHFTFLNDSINAMGIAIVHTTFNVLATACLLPFAQVLEKLAYLTIPEDEKQEQVQLLDERLLATPAVATERSKVLACKMADIARESLLQSMSLIRNWDDSIADAVTEKEAVTDDYEDQIGSYLVKLSSRSMTLADSRQVTGLLHSISDFERIGDHAVNLSMTVKKLNEAGGTFSAEAREELDVLEHAVQDILNRTIQAFANGDYDAAASVQPMNQVVNELAKEMKNRHVERLQTGQCSIKAGVALNDLITDLKRVAAHCANIAADMIEIQKDAFDRHAYRSESRSGEGFAKRYETYRQRYGLPVSEEAVK